MSRSFILFTVFTALAGYVSMGLPGFGSVAQGQTTSTAVVEDTFDDNKTGSLWTVFGSSSTVKATETNKHLEFTTPADSSETFVGYISNKWWVDPNEDFQMKADLYFDVTALASGWVTLGITPNSGAPENEYVMFGIGRSTSWKNYWWEGKTGLVTRTDFVGRTANSVTLYISYDSWNDILYLGDTGYGRENSWQILTDFTSNYWGRVPFYVVLGVTTNNLAITSGKVYIDNFVLEKGKIGSPYQSGDSGDSTDGSNVITDVEATLAVLPSTIKRKSTGDRVTAVITLPKEISLEYWDSEDVPTLSPGSIAANAQAAFLWVDGSVKILATFSKSALLEAITTDGEAEVYVVGTLKDDSMYAGTCTVTIE